MKFDLDFLKTVQIFGTVKDGATIDKGFIIKSNGSMVFSPKFYNIMDQGKKGFDIFLTTEWGQIKVDKKAILVTIVDIDEPKLDISPLFTYDADFNVYTCRPSKGSYKLLGLLEDLLGKQNSYHIDLSDITLSSPNNLYYIPKVITRGTNKGKNSYVRRENISVYPIQLLENLNEVEKSQNDSKVLDDKAPLRVITQEEAYNPTKTETEEVAKEIANKEVEYEIGNVYDNSSNIDETFKIDPAEDSNTVEDTDNCDVTEDLGNTQEIQSDTASGTQKEPEPEPKPNTKVGGTKVFNPFTGKYEVI